MVSLARSQKRINHTAAGERFGTKVTLNPRDTEVNGRYFGAFCPPSHNNNSLSRGSNKCKHTKKQLVFPFCALATTTELLP